MVGWWCCRRKGWLIRKSCRRTSTRFGGGRRRWRGVYSFGEEPLHPPLDLDGSMPSPKPSTCDLHSIEKQRQNPTTSVYFIYFLPKHTAVNRAILHLKFYVHSTVTPYSTYYYVYLLLFSIEEKMCKFEHTNFKFILLN